MYKFKIFLLLISFKMFSQDTLRFRSGETMAVKVNEIGISEIKYNRYDNINGPQYVVEKNDIRYIKYSNGQKDTFALIKPPQIINKPVEFQTMAPSNEKIVINGSKLFYHDRAIGEHKLLVMTNNLPQGEKKDRMRKTYEQMRQNKKNQYLAGFLGLGVGVAAPYIGFYASLFNGNGDFAPLGIGVIIGTGFGITGAAISSYYKRARTAKKLEMARIFNE